MSRRQPLIIGIVLGALALLLVIFLLIPKLGDVNKKRDELEQAQNSGQQLQAGVAALGEAKRQAPKIRRQLSRLETAIPPTADLPSLIRLLRTAADRAAVDFLAVSPGAPTVSTAGQFSQLPTQITVTGSFFSVDEFLYRLETLPREVKVTDVSLGAGPGGLPELQVAVSADVYTTDLSSGPGSQPGPTGG